MILDTPTPQSNRRLTVTALKFWTDYEKGPDEEMRAVDWVTWAHRGDLGNAANTDKVARIEKPLMSSDDNGQLEENPVWTAIKGQYEAWKKGQDVPINGTPLAAWSALTPAQATVFRTAGFASVEDIGQMTDALLAKIRIPNARQIRDMARAYSEHRAGNAVNEAKFATMASEMEALKAQLAEATEALTRLAEPEKRGPGRPRKEEVAA
jgi:hypothetical protein